MVRLEQKYGGKRERDEMGSHEKICGGLQGRVCKYEDMTEDETGAKERGRIVNGLFYLPKLISRRVFIQVMLDV